MDVKLLLGKIKPSKKVLAIVATVAALILGAQSGVSVDELVNSAEKIVPIVNAILGVITGSVDPTNATTVVTP